MTKYHLEVSGALSLEEIQNLVNGEEALVNTFIGLRLWVNGASQLTNLVEFEELDDAPVPQPGLLVLSVSEVGALTPVWVGTMIVDRAAKTMLIYRAA